MTVRIVVSSIFVAWLAWLAWLAAACSKNASSDADAAPPAARAAAVTKVSCADRGGGSMMLFWKECSDGINRTIGCDRKDGKVLCECRENDVVKKTFDATAHYEKDPTPLLPSHNPDAIVEQHCGWTSKR